MKKRILYALLILAAIGLCAPAFAQPVLSARQGGTGNGSYTIGDLLYASGTTTLSKLGIGSSGKVLSVSGGVPTWTTLAIPSVSGTTNYLAKFTASTSVGNSNIFDNGTRIGFNVSASPIAFRGVQFSDSVTAYGFVQDYTLGKYAFGQTPQSTDTKLQVQGGITAYANDNHSFLDIRDDSGSDMFYWINSSGSNRLTSWYTGSGYFGIIDANNYRFGFGHDNNWPTNPPAYQVEIRGSTRISDTTILDGKIKIASSAGANKVFTSDASGYGTWQTPAYTSALAFNSPLSLSSGTVSLNYGTGLSVSSGSLITSAIPNSALTNSTFTINGTGMALGTSSTVTAAAGTLTGTSLNGTVVSSSLTSVGTLTTGTWNGTAIANGYLANSTISGVSLGGTLANLTGGYGITSFTYTGAAAKTVVVDTSGSNAPASKLYTAAKYATNGAAVTVESEQNTTPVTDNNQTPIQNTNNYIYFTLPSTYKFYVITGIEWKNGTVVNGTTSGGVVLVDANPAVNATTISVANMLPVAQSGTSAVQRNSLVQSQLIQGGTLLAAWINSTSATGQYRYVSGQPSINTYKSITASTTPAYSESTAWSVTTNYVYLKVYYKGVN